VHFDATILHTHNVAPESCRGAIVRIGIQAKMIVKKLELLAIVLSTNSQQGAAIFSTEDCRTLRICCRERRTQIFVALEIVSVPVWNPLPKMINEF